MSQNNKPPFFADLKGELKFIGAVAGFFLFIGAPFNIEYLMRDKSEKNPPFIEEKNVEIKQNALDTLTNELDGLPEKSKVDLRVDTPNIHKSQKSH